MPGPVPRHSLLHGDTPCEHAHCLRHGTWQLSSRGICLTQEVAIRTVKQSTVLREVENGEEGEEEGADFGEEDLFHQQVCGAHSQGCSGAVCHALGLAGVGLRQCPGDPRRRVLEAESLSGGVQPWGFRERSPVPPSLVWWT